MANAKDNKRIEDAFKIAAAEINGGKDKVDHMLELFEKDFPRTMTAFDMAFGEGRGLKLGMLMLAQPDIFALIKCFFISGYKTREEEENGEGK